MAKVYQPSAASRIDFSVKIGVSVIFIALAPKRVKLSLSCLLKAFKRRLSLPPGRSQESFLQNLGRLPDQKQLGTIQNLVGIQILSPADTHPRQVGRT